LYRKRLSDPTTEHGPVNEGNSEQFKISNKSIFSLVNSAIYITLPAFAAERRAVAQLLLGARRPSLSMDMFSVTANPPHAAAAVGQTVIRTDGHSAVS